LRVAVVLIAGGWCLLTMAECSESNNKNIQSSKYLSPLKDSNDASIARRSDLGDPIPYPSPAMESSSTTAPTAAPNDGTDAPSRPPVFTSPLSKYEIRELLLEEAGYDCNNPATALAKRTDYLSWDDYFMAIASLSAHRSKDPILPKGACLVDSENRVIGIGYNGFPRGCPDDLLPWQTSCTHDLPFLHTPSPYECHAEVNAILNKCSADVAGARMYVAHFPCKL
jgi:deoxycytidylate deaminase